ncbi:MAG: phosphatidylcholine/phosphatidylserine synthase [Acetobacter sp.]
MEKGHKNADNWQAVARRTGRVALCEQGRGQFLCRLAPNILTMLGLCSGLAGMGLAVEGAFQLAAVALLVCAIIDGVDGRVARMLNGSTRFGAQFDSLSDFLCFGVAPSFVLYFWALKEAGRYAFLPCLLFSVCMALRLARFNADLDDHADRPAYAYNFFTGVPAPAGAGLALFPLFLGLEAQKLGLDGLYCFTRLAWLPVLSLCGTGFLLVSTFPVWSFKTAKIKRAFLLPAMLAAVLYVGILSFALWGALAATGLIYIGMLPFSRMNFQNLKKMSGKIEPLQK